MAGDDSDNVPSAFESPTSAGFNTDLLPNNTSQPSDDEEPAVYPHIIPDEPEELEAEEEDEEEDLYNDNFMDDYQMIDEDDQYEPLGLDDSVEDERDLDQIMLDRRAAELELDARDARFFSRNLPELLRDQDDDDNYRPSKRSRVDFRPPAAPRSFDDTDGMQSSPGRSHSRDDTPMTDHTDSYQDEDEDDDQGDFEMYSVQGTLREWVARDEVRRFISRKFKDFLLTYVNPKNSQGKP